MNIKFSTIICLFFVLFTAAVTVSSDPVLPSIPYNYSALNLPAHYTTDAGGPLPTSINAVDNTPATNPVTDAGATLGRVLFYDVNLSSNRTIACASCHKQNAGFSDPSVLSIGFAGGTTVRHSMTLINARYYQRGRAFWDERAATMEEQVLMPFQDATEMGLTLTTLLQRINEQTYYAPLFNTAFGDKTVTTDRVSKALAQFVRSIVSYSSKYDVGRAMVNNPGANFPNFTTEENTGKQLFFAPIPNGGGACFGCHTTEAFVNANGGPQNNGIDATSTTDLGAGAPTALNRPNLIGRFKNSSLRNIELTAPYMHDGRFQTLEQVVEHYNSGIKAHPTLSPALTDANNNPIRLNFNTAQKAAMVAFLKTLTDNSVATNPKWSNPFITIVPIELINFSGKLLDNKINVVWQTASELNNDYFAIEKSLDGNTWAVIGEQKGGGSTKSIQNYSFDDVNVAEGRQYYRLKQVDFNKRFTYSKVISIENKILNLPQIMVYPNPTAHQVTVNLGNLIANNSTRLELINAAGQIVFVKNNLSNTLETIDLSPFPSEQYFILIKSNGKIISKKLIKN